MHYNSAMESSREVCIWCGRQIGDVVSHKKHGDVILRKHLDHFLPRAFFRYDAKGNLFTACHLCNLWKSDIVFGSLQEGREYLKIKWRENTNEQMQDVQQGLSTEEELATILQQEMPVRSLASKSVSPLSELWDDGFLRGKKENFKDYDSLIRLVEITDRLSAALKSALLEKRPCGKCQRLFQPDRPTKRYCGKRCYWAAHARRYYRTSRLPKEAEEIAEGEGAICANAKCSNLFSPRKGKKFCSSRCRVNEENRRYANKRESYRKKIPSTV